MSKFVFQDNSLKLDINDEIFIISPEKMYKNKEFLEIAKEAESIAEDKDKTPSVEVLEKLEGMMVKGLDLILGKGATKKIFKERAINYFDLMDVYAYVIEMVDDYHREKEQKKYLLKHRSDEHIN